MTRQPAPGPLKAEHTHDADRHRRSLHVVLTGVSSDSHTWNLVFLQLLLQHQGHRVTNLGACAPDDEVVETCLDRRPDLLVVSTVNGLGNIDGERLIRRVRGEARLMPLPAVIGGKLGIRGEDNRSFTHALLQAGYGAVFADDTALERFASYLEQLRSERDAARTLEVAT